MPQEFSPIVKDWLANQDVLLAAEDRFRGEWGDILRRVAGRLAERGFTTVLTGEPPEEVKALRPGWPGGVCGVHYEARAFPEQRRRGIVDLSLHVEQDLDNQEQVCNGLRQLLRRHGARVPEACAAATPDEPREDILKGSLPIEGITSGRLLEAIARLALTDSFVEEALFLADRQPLWRTDFLPGDPEVAIDVTFGQGTSERGGWEFGPHAGRFQGRGLEARPGEHNFRNGTNILMLNRGLFHDFVNAQAVYGCATVAAGENTELTLCLQTDKSHGWAIAFEQVREVRQCESWQLVTWQGRIAGDEGHDFAEEGLYAYLIAGPVTRPLRIGSLAVGICP